LVPFPALTRPHTMCAFAETFPGTFHCRLFAICAAHEGSSPYRPLLFPGDSSRNTRVPGETDGVANSRASSSTTATPEGVRHQHRGASSGEVQHVRSPGKSRCPVDGHKKPVRGMRFPFSVAITFGDRGRQRGCLFADGACVNVLAAERFIRAPRMWPAMALHLRGRPRRVAAPIAAHRIGLAGCGMPGAETESAARLWPGFRRGST